MKHHNLSYFLTALLFLLPALSSAQVATTTAVQPAQTPYAGYPELKLSADIKTASLASTTAAANWYNPFSAKAPAYGVSVLFINHQDTGTFGIDDQFVVDCNGDRIADYSVRYIGQPQFVAVNACKYARAGTYTVQGTVLTNVSTDSEYRSPYGYDTKYGNNYISRNCPSGCYAKAVIIVTEDSLRTKQPAAALLTFPNMWNVFKSFFNLFKI